MRRIVLLMVLVIVTVAGLSVQSASAQQGVTWNSQFFNNPYLSGSAVLTRRDSAMAFNWGTGSPGANVPVDNFSGRISTDVYFPAGTYRFYILADDGVNLYVDFRSYINTWEQPRPGQLLTADVPLAAGTWHIQIDYRENTGNAYLYVSWANLASNPAGPNFPSPSVPAPSSGPWTGQYYNNAGLAGAPTAIISESTPTHNWGSNAPMVNVGADNFSARWSSTQYVEGGTYQLNVHADDGVRVYVNGVRYIDEWHSASGRTHTTVLYLPTGQHSFVVEYYEAAGLAFLEYSLFRTTNPGSPVQNTGPVATVTTYTLNVRSGPNTGYAVLMRIGRGESYPVLGRSQDSGWWQIRVNNVVGWVSGVYVTVSNAQNVPTTGGNVPSPVTATGYVLRAQYNLNVRSGPGTFHAIVNRIPMGGTAQIVARNASGTWWRVVYNGTVGWVSGAYVILPSNLNMAAIPTA